MAIQLGKGQLTVVGMGELKQVKNSGLIGCIGLGSCIGALLYDPVSRLALCAHVMLPESLTPDNEPVKGKFADTAVPELLRIFEKNNSNRRHLIAALIGGAELFRTVSTSESLRIGARNTERVTKLLQEAYIPIKISEVGGKNGRSFQFDAATGSISIKSSGGEAKEYQLVQPSMMSNKAA